MIRVENMNLLLQRYVWNMVLFNQTTAPYTPQSNGLVERKNRTLKEMMYALMINSGSPRNLWGKSSLHIIKYSIEYPIEKHNQFHMSCGKEEYPT